MNVGHRTRIRIKYRSVWDGRDRRSTIVPVDMILTSTRCQICGGTVERGGPGYRDVGSAGYHVGCVEDHAKVIPLAGQERLPHG